MSKMVIKSALKTTPKTAFSHEYDEKDLFIIGDLYHTKVYESKTILAVLKKDAADSVLDDVDTAIGVCKIYEQKPMNDLARLENPETRRSVRFETELNSVKMKYVESWEYLDVVKDTIFGGKSKSISQNNIEKE